MMGLGFGVWVVRLNRSRLFVGLGGLMAYIVMDIGVCLSG